MDRRQVCAQVLQSSLLPQAIGFYTLASRTPTYRHKRQIFTATSDWKKETAILLPQAIRPWNAAPATQKQQSPAALKNITCGSKKMNVLTATSDWGILPPQAKYEPYIYIDKSNDRIQHDVIWYGVICNAICVYTFGQQNEYHSSNLTCLCACFDTMISNSQSDLVTTLSRYSLQLILLVSVCKYTSDIAL